MIKLYCDNCEQEIDNADMGQSSMTYIVKTETEDVSKPQYQKREVNLCSKCTDKAKKVLDKLD